MVEKKLKREIDLAGANPLPKVGPPPLLADLPSLVICKRSVVRF